MRPSFRLWAGWVCLALTATAVSWVAIRDVVATAAVGDPVPAHAVVAVGGAEMTAPPSAGRARQARPTATAEASASLETRPRLPTATATRAPSPTATPAPSTTPTGTPPYPSYPSYPSYPPYPYNPNPNPYWSGSWGCDYGCPPPGP
jgi:hypothetical protein